MLDEIVRLIYKSRNKQKIYKSWNKQKIYKSWNKLQGHSDQIINMISKNIKNNKIF